MGLRDLGLVRWLLALGRNSPWLMIAVGLHLTLGAVLSVVYLQRVVRQGRRIDSTIGAVARAPVERPVLPEPEPAIDRHKIPDQDAEHELRPDAIEPHFVPTTDPEPEDAAPGDPLSAFDGDGDGLGATAISVGPGGGRYGDGTPNPYGGRPGGRAGPGPGGGGGGPRGPTEKTEKAVFEGLAWLARHQDEDGAWRLESLAQHCDPRSPCLPAGTEVHPFYDECLTVNALLAFLGAGHGINSRHSIDDPVTGERRVLGPIVKAGVRWLVARQQEDGSFTPARAFLYNEALASAALCEAYGLSKNRELKRPAQRAVDFLLAAQKLGPGGERTGWRYGSRAQLEAEHAAGGVDEATYRAESAEVDISVTTWVVMALKSADLAGLDVPREALESALAYARSVSAPDGRVAYFDAAPGERIRGTGDHFEYHPGTMSALGMLVRTFVARDVSDEFLEAAAEQIAKDPPVVSKDALSIDYYYWYYGTLALHQFDGPDSPRKGAGRYWRPWNEALAAALLPLQDASSRQGACRRGAWLADDRWSRHGHALYNTALCVLTLEVYYRYENAFGAR